MASSLAFRELRTLLSRVCKRSAHRKPRRCVTSFAVSHDSVDQRREDGGARPLALTMQRAMSDGLPNAPAAPRARQRPAGAATPTGRGPTVLPARDSAG